MIATMPRSAFAELGKYRGLNPLVLGIPRGAVPMARVIAGKLAGEVKVALVRKLGHPVFRSTRSVPWNEMVGRMWPPTLQRRRRRSAYLEQEDAGAGRCDEGPAHRLHCNPSAADPHGESSYVVDDGLATRRHHDAALHALRARIRQIDCAVR